MTTVDSLRKSVQTSESAHGYDVCRLTLVINGIAHIVHPTDGNSVFAAVRAFRLRRVGGGSVYVVAQTPTGNVCNCPASQGTTNPPCKHVRALVVAGVLDGDARPVCLRHEAHTDATLAEHVHNEANAYRAIGTPLAKLFANTMDALSLKITLTQAATADEYEPRIDALEADIRERWEARGYEEGRRAICHCRECPVD